jgi:hypothetical protein
VPAPAADTCSAFVDFYTDITTNTPHAPDLPGKAQAVQTAANSTGQYVAQAGALVADVTRTDFAANGNALDPAISALYALCYPGSP